ncbi:hypothetical protein DSCW_05240 [Desulfosarcina widdelii]|uniref:Uncharacterized protein n=1 Tax=Desulfosarcina widdelii TaxID=947919 RepID=A0A5K7Z9E8_9BACT|nr:hypothetical protein DSCW_05240 [Desulfosarcina widdelii]
MLFKPKIDKTVISVPAIWMDNAVRNYMITIGILQCGIIAIRKSFGINIAEPF